uniref:Uncharacterized protein n=1 Tax=Acrobeloides nanus TaxID=290746 RepID=A0A914EHJ7_9BILA
MLIVEIIGGIFSNSLALITDGARLFADHLSNYVINRDRAEGTWRRIELAFLVLCVAFLWFITAAFIFAASERIYSNNFNLNVSLMFAASIVGLTCNVITLMMHFTEVLSPRKYTPLPDYISVKCHQFVHAFGNHGIGTVVFLSATIIFIFPQYKFVDSIATYILAVLLVANTIGIINKVIAEMSPKVTYDVI